MVCVSDYGSVRSRARQSVQAPVIAGNSGAGTFFVTRSAMSHGLAVDNGPDAWVEAESGDHIRSLADDPGFLAALDDLDRGVFGFIADTRKMVPRPPLIAQLVVPGARVGRHGPRTSARRVPVAARRTGISVWAASWIILAALTGASAAGLVFHAQLSQIMLKWEGTAGHDKSIAVLSASVR